MSRIVLILLLLGGILFWWHWENTPDPEERKKLLQKTLIGGLIVIAVLLVAAGRMHWLGAVFAGMLAFLKQGLSLLIRFFPVLTHLYRTHAPAARPPDSSTVNTDLIEMTLDHDSGRLSGRVLSGEYKGRSLDDLSDEDLAGLYAWCKQVDMDSARLLESYLAARFDESPGAETGTQDRSDIASTEDMTVREAIQVLGLSATPTEAEITKAYRKVMQQLHPDRGGNEYFAAKANQAREVLIRHLQQAT